MKALNFCCIECGSVNAEIKFPGVGKCVTCGAYFDLEELPTKVEKIKHKPCKEEDEEDN